jgi:hypothetical protein
MDEDLDQMTREEVIEEAKKLRRVIRQHRDSSGHELCWHHPAFWGLLPEKTDPVPVVPQWPEFRGEVASNIGSPWMNRRQTPRGQMNHIRSESLSSDR